MIQRFRCGKEGIKLMKSDLRDKAVEFIASKFVDLAQGNGIDEICTWVGWKGMHISERERVIDLFNLLFIYEDEFLLALNKANVSGVGE